MRGGYLKILYVAMKNNDYGTIKSDFSFEHYNFYDSLVKMNNGSNEIIYFPFDELLQKLGKETMNDELIRIALKTKPDLCFFFLFRDEIKPSTLKKLTSMGLTTFNWFADDHWRFEIFSRYYAKYFSFVSTTDINALQKYQKMGYKNVIKTQWACNNFLYKPTISNKYYDVTFIGQKYGNRESIVNAVRNKEIEVRCWGKNWEGDRISQKDMIKTFSQSKINLNFSFSSVLRNSISTQDFAAIFMRREPDGKYHINRLGSWLPQLKLLFNKQPYNQIKGRIFEITGSGGFLLTEWAKDIENYYKIDKEISVFKDTSEIIKKIEYYLNNEKKRKQIAYAGYKRTITQHTYEKRFNELFKEMGL